MYAFVYFYVHLQACAMCILVSESFLLSSFQFIYFSFFPCCNIKELKVESSRDIGLILDYRNEVLADTSGEKRSNPLDVGSSKFNEQLSREQLDLNFENPSGKLRCKGPLSSDAINSTSDSRIRGGEFEALNRRTKPSDTENKAVNDNEELPSLELSLKRLRGVKDAGITSQDERNVLRRSDLSAFSRYDDFM